VSVCSACCLADCARRQQLAVALLLLTCIADGRLRRGELRLLLDNRGLLPTCIDLHQRRALPDAIAGGHVNLRNLPVNLRCTVVERSDLSDATYSLASSIGVRPRCGERNRRRRQALSRRRPGRCAACRRRSRPATASRAAILRMSITLPIYYTTGLAS